MNISNKSLEQLLELQKQLSEDPSNKLPKGTSIYIYNEKTRKTLDKLAWAIAEKVAESRGQRIQGATFKNYKTRR